MANLDYDNVDHIVLPQYNNDQQLANVNVRQMRGIMRYHNIPYLDDDENILPQFRTNGGALIRRRAPYINAIIAHFQQHRNDDEEDEDDSSENNDDDLKQPEDQ